MPSLPGAGPKNSSGYNRLLVIFSDKGSVVLFSLELLSISGSLYSCITAQDLIFDYPAPKFQCKNDFFFFVLSTSAGYMYHGFSETSPCNEDESD